MPQMTQPAPGPDSSGTYRFATRGPERRKATLRALWLGSFHRRRFGARRENEHHISSTDWHHPQWLAVALAILVLCCADAFLTLTLINHGASEMNPFMQSLLTGTGRSFALWKLGLTASGVILLILLVKARAFGRWSVGPLLYAVLLGYAALVGYEVWLLQRVPGDIWPVVLASLR